MADKKVLANFRGELPRLPDKDLPIEAASRAINTRLSNGEIRPYPIFEDSVDEPNPTLNPIVSGGYTNFFKASPDTVIHWMSWTANDDIPILEVRYNDISAYDSPEPPVIAIPDGEELAVAFRGRDVSNRGEGTEEWVSATTRGANINGVEPGREYPWNTPVEAYVDNELAPISTVLWEYVSGDVTILPAPPNAASTEFNTQLSFPAVPGIEQANTRTAIWRCTITDTSGNVGTKEIQVQFSAYLFYSSGTGPDPIDDEPFWDIK